MDTTLWTVAEHSYVITEQQLWTTGGILHGICCHMLSGNQSNWCQLGSLRTG